MEKLRFGMIGGAGGFIGDVHRKGAQMDDLALLAAGCFSREPSKNLQTAVRWNVTDHSRVYDSYQQMAEQEARRPDPIDFVIIATPNDTHYPIARLFLEHGIPVMCDKPLALTVEQGLELEALARQRQLLFGVTYTYTGYAMVRQAQAMIAAGEIGAITAIQGEYPQEWLAVSLVSNHSDQATWRHDPARSGPSGCCADIGTHVECLIRKITGLEPRWVIARFDKVPAMVPLETNVQVMIDYEGGVPGLIWTSQIALGHETELTVRIFGEKGSIEWSHLRPWELRVTRINQPPQTYTASRDYLYPEARALCRLPTGHIEGFYEAFGNLYRGFCSHLATAKFGGDPSPFSYPTIQDGIQGLKFVEACLKSNAANNVWIEV